MNISEAITIIRQQQQSHEVLGSFIATQFPTILRAIRLVDSEHIQPKQPKGYYLFKRENKKHGYLYYVRYSHNGKMLPTKWNTHTNILEEAERFAKENKVRLVELYLRSHDVKIYTLLESFYSSSSNEYLVSGNDKITERSRRDYHGAIVNRFIPFLKKKNIKQFNEVTPHLLSDYQDWLLARGIKPQTVNNNYNAIKKIFKYLFRKAIISEDPSNHVQSIPVHQSDLEARGCYNVERLRGVFNKKWKDELSYLLCTLIYSTGMRNNEIEQFSMDDVIIISGCRFIDIKKSKTQNGIRLVPLHKFVYEKLLMYSKKTATKEIFKGIHSRAFTIANLELARKLKIDKEEVKTENITFYSGRHFWKTLMNSEGLGDDIEEIFMGHAVSGNVAKLYNHRDKQGNKRLIKKAKQVFAILDKCLLCSKR